jgi:GNAT superfamily N-acetyltransferase
VPELFCWARDKLMQTPRGSRNAFEREIRMLKIRNAEASDAALILTFIRALAEYEHLSRDVVATEQDLLRDGFGAEPKYRCVIAEWDQTPVGFALYFYNYSTFQGRPGIFLEDLFVNPEFRGKGIGRALLVHLAQLAVRENCGRYVWQVLDWNTPSIEFYKSLGAKMMREWLTMRVEDTALENMAAQGQPTAEAND